MKALYLATYEATKKWTMQIRNWSKVRGELSIIIITGTISLAIVILFSFSLFS